MVEHRRLAATVPSRWGATSKVFARRTAGAPFFDRRKRFSALQTALPSRYLNDNFFLKWILLLPSKRITTHTRTLANMNTTSLVGGANIFSPPTIRSSGFSTVFAVWPSCFLVFA